MLSSVHFYTLKIEDNRINHKETRKIEGNEVDSPTSSVPIKFWRVALNFLGDDMFLLHINKNQIILFATYMHILSRQPLLPHITWASEMNDELITPVTFDIIRRYFLL